MINDINVTINCLLKESNTSDVFLKDKIPRGKTASRVEWVSVGRWGCWGCTNSAWLSFVACIYFFWWRKKHYRYNVVNVTQQPSIFTLTQSMQTHSHPATQLPSAEQLWLVPSIPAAAITSTITCSVLQQSRTFPRSGLKCVQCLHWACFHRHSTALAACRGYKVHSLQPCTCFCSLRPFHSDSILQYSARNAGKKGLIQFRGAADTMGWCPTGPGVQLAGTHIP